MHLEDVPTVMLVASGKGGVGKTTVASDIALAADALGATVGLADADISTPNAPEVVGGEDNDISGQRLSTSDALVPPTINGIELASQGTILPDDVPVLRDGSWRAEAVADYIQNVEWRDETDIVVIDTPPGTGEELQVIASLTPVEYAYVISTPHPSALRDATKTHEFFKQADIEHGAILNMAHIPSDDIVRWVQKHTDFTEVQNIGDAREQTLVDLMAENTPHYPLFGHDPGAPPEFPVGFDATIPYTAQRGKRIDVVAQQLRDRLAVQEAEA